ncbi:DoxX family protein [Mangrovihabitans endophyticus]|uniref:Integral membrane protein n=1 Tax=Mangrovihabitans endophyticus TaxID=1751298 RepID=A0A8J3BY29_9ACTN|nr:DoxX family protein [Mangrovihabitans endophyticus]GGK90713.1 integral membrane protein [Mangrovihabitans endophyticus]
MDLHRFSGPMLSAFRIVVGLLFLTHGSGTVFGLFGGAQGSGAALPTGQWPGWWAGLIQVVCGLLVMVGLVTRPAALLASGSMAYAYFTVHQSKGVLPTQNGGEPAALYAWAFLAIAVLGAGPWALDALMTRRRRTVDEVDDDVDEQPVPA